MHLLALVSGLASVLAIPLFYLLHRPSPLDWGLLIGLVALAAGVASRKRTAGKIGAILGVLGVGVNFFYLHYLIQMRPYKGPDSQPPPGISQPGYAPVHGVPDPSRPPPAT